MATPIITPAEARAQGLKRFFTGKPCNQGHRASRLLPSGSCAECARLYALQYVISRDRRAYFAARRAAARATRGIHPRTLARQKGETTYYTGKACPKGHLASRFVCDGQCSTCKAARYKTVEYKSRKRVYFEKNREQAVVRVHRRRARKIAAGGTHTVDDLHEILKMQKGRCAYCRVDLKKARKQIDHIVPIARGGSNARSNLQFLCFSCNQSKRAKDPLDYARSIGFLL